VDDAVSGGMDFNTAATTIGQELSKEITAGARDKDSNWFRVPSSAGGAADFPNLNKGNLPALEKANRRYAALKKDIFARGVSAVLETPESIFTREAGLAIKNGYGKPGWTVPSVVSAVQGFSNGADAFTIINKAFSVMEPPIPPLDPPQIITDLNAQITPEFQALINRAKNKAQAERAYRQGFSQTSGDTSAFRNSGSMRAGSPMRTFAGSRQQNAFIQTIRTVEGTSGPQGYNTVYGGAVVPQLTQMTLGELYDAIKLGGTDAIPARLGGGKIPFKKDKYNSSASGALQLMPETLRGLIEGGGYSWNDTFTPETQNQMILDLAKQAGVDIENMSPSGMSKGGNVWAGLSPRYGQTSRTAADSYSIYQKLLQQ
jgi:muramidase (phage lysozyme)